MSITFDFASSIRRISTTTNIHTSDSNTSREQIKQFYDVITKYVNVQHLMMSLIDVIIFNDVILTVSKKPC